MLPSMVYFCYIHRKTGGAPHFEVLPETSQTGAMTHAAQMLSQHANAERAEVWDDERLVFSLPHAPPAGSGEAGPSAG
jgi:hypothetical protein